MGLSNLTFRPGKNGRNICRTVAKDRTSNKRMATASVENILAIKSRRLSNNINPRHRYSTRLNDEKRPYRVSLRPNDGLPKEKTRSLVSKREEIFKVLDK